MGELNFMYFLILNEAYCRQMEVSGKIHRAMYLYCKKVSY